MPGTVIALLLIGMAVSWLVPSASEVIGPVGFLVALYGGAYYYFSRSRQLPKREKRAWQAMGAAVALVGTGVLAVGLATELGNDVPAFGPLDVFFLAGYAMFVVAMTRLARADGDGPGWLLTILDGLVGAIALSALVWTALGGQLLDALSGATWWETVIAATYPILDAAAVIALMILVIRRSHFHLDARLVFLAAGLSAQVLADFAYLSSGLGSTFAEAEPAWILNLFATTMLFMTAVLVDRVPRKREFPEVSAPIWAMAWPYLFAAALLGVHVAEYRSLDQGLDQVILLDAVLAVGAVIFLRQVVVIHRNQTRVEQQRSELIGSVSHELRTPLTAIVGYLSLLEENPEGFPEDARQEMIGEATDSARHMSRLVSDLLMLARGDNRHLVLELGDVKVSSLMMAALRTVDTGNTRIEDIVEGDTEVRVDEDRIQQAVGNLIGNAVKYGGARVQLVAKVQSRDLVIEVHDDGPGVPTRYEATIWQRFERGAHRLDASTPGLGIGLAIVRAVADSHGGHAVYRRSERLGGACFSLSIPNAVTPRGAVEPRDSARTQSIEPVDVESS